MSSSIFISGLASGIDTDSMIEKMMSLERRPQLFLEQKTEVLAGKQNVYSTLSARLAALENVVKQFRDVGSPFFTQKIAESTDTGVAAATIVGANPATGSYQVAVTQLATAALVRGLEPLYTGVDSVALPARAQSSAGINAPALTVDPTQSLSSQAGNLSTAPTASGTIEVNGVSIDWDDSMSLNDVMGLINNVGAGATASFDAGTQILNLQTSDTGSAATLTVDQTAGNFWNATNITIGSSNGSDAVSPNLSEPVGAAAANLDVAITTGTFSVNGVVFHVDAAVDNLQTILSRISSSSAGVTASYDESTGSLSLFQNETGSSQGIVLGAAGDTSNALFALKLSATNPPVGGPADTYMGSDAQVSVNGAPVQNFTDNTVSGLIPGVSLSLNGLGTTSITIGADEDAMVETVANFVAEYNNIMSYINSKTREERIENPSSITEILRGTFVADRLFLSTKDQLGVIVTSAVSGLSGTMNQMAQAGITTVSANFGKDAILELDEEKLRAALQNDPEGVAALFNSASGGVMTQLEEKLDSMTDLIYGSFTLEDKSLEAGIKTLNEQISTMELRLLKREDTLRRQFVAMETAVARLNSMGLQLTSILGQVGGDK